MLSSRYIYKICKPLVFSLFSLFMINGCSVYKAASNDGVSVKEIQTCKVKGSLLAKGMERIEVKEHKDGRVTETYRAKASKSGFNYVRAAGHGALDVMTLGLWEVVGTPVEGALSNNRHYVVAKATFSDKHSEQIQELEIYDPNGRKVQ